MNALEQRIVAALANNDIVSTDLAMLIGEIEVAIVEVDTIAETAHKQALDPALSPNLSEARAAKENAELAAARLRTLLRRSQQRLEDVRERETLAQWHGNYEALRIEGDALADEFAETYPECERRIASLLSRMAAHNAKASDLHRARPAGVALHLIEPELVARGLESFTTANPSISKTMQLPDFEHSNRMAWPPPSTPLAVLASQAVPALAHSGGEWWRGREERAAAQRAEQERVAAYYADQQRRREEREAAEAQARRSRA